MNLRASKCVLHKFEYTVVPGDHGDKPDGVLYTGPHKKVKIGESVVLKCQFSGKPLAVYWKKGYDPTTASNIITRIPGDPVTGVCSGGERPCQIMEMNENYSLIIKNISIAEQGRYFCMVANYMEIHNFTDITVFSSPHEPYPVIKPCSEDMGEESNNLTSVRTCSITSNDAVNITCMASGYYPNIELSFRHGFQKISDISYEWTNEDGTKSKSVSIKGSASETPYVCSASSIPGYKGQRNVSVIVSLPATPSSTDDNTYDDRKMTIVVPAVVCVVAVLLVLLAYLWLRRRRRGEGGEISEHDLEEAESLMGINGGVKRLIRKITNRHWRRLAQHIGVTSEDAISKISNENYGTLFDIESMISEWMEGGGKKKKRKLDKILRSASRMKTKFHTGHGSRKLSAFVDEEHQRIASYLSFSQLKELFDVESNDPQKAIRTIREYIKISYEKNPKQSFRGMLRKKLETIGSEGIIPFKQGSKVYLRELLEVAFRLLLEDVRPLSRALDIPDKQLKKYRVDYVPGHLSKGTTAALVKFSETNENNRRKICEVLSNAGYEQIALLLKYGYATSLADELAVASAVKTREALENISRNLGMTDIPVDNDSAEKVLRDWKATVHPPSYNHRTSLADAVCPVLGPCVAVSILTGQYRENGNASSLVIQRIIGGIESFEESHIASVIAADNKKMLPNQQVITYSDLTHQIEDSSVKDERLSSEDQGGEGLVDYKSANHSALAHRIGLVLGTTDARTPSSHNMSIRQTIQTWAKTFRQKPLNEDGRRKLSDDLLRAGFVEFSSEIMAGFVPEVVDENHSPIGTATQVAPVLRLWQQRISEVAESKET